MHEAGPICQAAQGRHQVEQAGWLELRRAHRQLAPPTWEASTSSCFASAVFCFLRGTMMIPGGSRVLHAECRDVSANILRFSACWACWAGPFLAGIVGQLAASTPNGSDRSESAVHSVIREATPVKVADRVFIRHKSHEHCCLESLQGQRRQWRWSHSVTGASFPKNLSAWYGHARPRDSAAWHCCFQHCCSRLFTHGAAFTDAGMERRTTAWGPPHGS